eukprot:Gb_39704 [translate_table: standard]
MGRRKANQMTHIVLLKRIMKVANARKAISGIRRSLWSPNKCRSSASPKYSEEDELRILPTDVPEGHFVVYVGANRSRFVVPISYLKQPLFTALLQKAAEEFGSDHQRGLTIPCDEIAFEHITSLL